MGSIGRYGRNSTPPAMLKTLPKLELVPIRRYLRTLAKAFRPSTIPLVQDVQAALAQDDVGSVLGDVHGVGHRDADIGGVERRRVVDAVAEKAHDVPAVLEGQDDPVLLRRRHPREDARAFGHGAERRLAQMLQFVAQHHPPTVEPHLLAHVGGRRARCRR